MLVIGAGVSGISIARGLLRDGHDVTVFEQRADTRAGGGAVTVWPNGAAVLRQLGVDMDGAGQPLSRVRVQTSRGRRLATLDVTAMADRLGEPVRMVPRRLLLDRLSDGFPVDRIRCNARAVEVAPAPGGAEVRFEDGSVARGDVVIGADGLHSILRDVLGAPAAEPTGWCSWQGLAAVPEVTDSRVAMIAIGAGGNVGVWPAGGCEVQWWFDLPWSHDFVRPPRPLELLRSNFTGWSDIVDLVLGRLTDDDLTGSPYPHFRHPVAAALPAGPLTLLGDAAHTMPPTLAQGTNQALLDTMVLCKALSQVRNEGRQISRALRRYEQTRRRRVAAVSRVAALQVAHGESVLRPAALIPDRLHTRLLTAFLGATSHRRMSAEIDRGLAAATPVPAVRP
ncbi:2-polyprenyl-6-methoxyphenol hydroxylase [Mycobacterium sp. E3198]|nr:NAD(P)/FAD-dependent oxidoreductase [Mycobacterium sp. E3198]OBG36054.1 2-polyprenyl-6-methoxyphenol hydroxylase [Mycobacterium sp. E3198]